MSIKKTTIIMVAIVGAIVGLQSCYKVATVPKSTVEEVTANVSFATDIQPILTANCSVIGCHSAGGRSPDLTAEKAYNALSGANYIDVGNPENSNIYLWIIGKKTTPMPPAGANPSNLNNLVLAWIKQGAQNN